MRVCLYQSFASTCCLLILEVQHAFLTLVQAANSLALGTSPIVRALVDPEGGMRSVRALDNVSFTHWFKSHGGSEGSIRRMWDPIAYALGFLNCDQVCLYSARLAYTSISSFFLCMICMCKVVWS